MGDRVWQVPQDQFVAAWSGSESLDEAAAGVGGAVTAVAVQAAVWLRKSARHTLGLVG